MHHVKYEILITITFSSFQNLVKPHLEILLKIAQFGMRDFMEKRFNHLGELCTAINYQKVSCVRVQCERKVIYFHILNAVN